MAGQRIFPAHELTALGSGAAGSGAAGSAAGEHPSYEPVRGTIAGQQIFATGEPTRAPALGEDELLITPDSRAVAGQATFAEHELAPLHAPQPAAAAVDIAPDGYEIGEEHPSIRKSDAVFEARQALELGALELTIGRLDQRQLSGYRILAESCVPFVDHDRFVDADAYTEANAAFHDYLFTLTGNEHLRQAYERLGVKNHMNETLRGATWCHPLCTRDHLDIVTAFERGDRERARELFIGHSQRSQETTRRAMREQEQEHSTPFSPGRFAGKVVLVTGAAQGIGEQVARRIHAEGGELVLGDRSPLVTELANELTRHGAKACAIETDLETFEGATELVERGLARFGRIDVMINNVGGAIWFKPFQEFTPAQIDSEIRRSLMTTLYSCRAVLPHLVAQGHGTIVNVSSIATGGIYRVPYAAAKGGVNAITRALAVEAAEHGVRVVATAPGGTQAPPRRIPRGPSPESEQEKDWFDAHITQTLDSSLMKRYGTLVEQAAVIAFPASDEASYVTGTIIPVAGGDLG